MHVERMQTLLGEQLEEGDSVLADGSTIGIGGKTKSMLDSTVTVDLHKESLAHKTHPTLLTAGDESMVAPMISKVKDGKKSFGLKNGKEVVKSDVDAETGRERAAAREKLMAEILTEAERKGEKLSKTELKRR